jgi:hypothetical protein
MLVLLPSYVTDFGDYVGFGVIWFYIYLVICFPKFFTILWGFDCSCSL